ncbi:hypothetical protein [Hymenobacter guriensis]|uniref:Lipoprotein n=1 Tax=Hymenobacter guriensis TaxID=2793065 RepID=A0ABS0L7S5_9BACT|nr:hypothetical protein [Hymenobacter guriensis]MBG8556203.1 hypothetical protein [Hymenobacter guriensis]
MLRLLLVWTLLFQSSCVGFSIVAGTKQLEVGKSLGPTIGEDGRLNGGTTPADALRLWGKPHRIVAEGTQEKWIYKSGELAWRGMEVWAIVPVPLLLPVGHRKVALEFTNGQLVNYTVGDGRERFFGYFILQTDSKVWRFNWEARNSCDVGYGCK